MNTWNLTKLYKGFDDPAFKSDSQKLVELIDELIKKESAFTDYENKADKLKDFLETEIKLTHMFDRLMSFSSLVNAVESTNLDSIKSLNSFQMQMTRLAKIETLFQKW
ncbi:MAG TPA: hypothetical protein PKU69_03620, partial [Bacillota bacterium]|nr:hypothetical protein [Bacillota bacterium]